VKPGDRSHKGAPPIGTQSPAANPVAQAQDPLVTVVVFRPAKISTHHSVHQRAQEKRQTDRGSAKQQNSRHDEHASISPPGQMPARHGRQANQSECLTTGLGCYRSLAHLTAFAGAQLAMERGRETGAWQRRRKAPPRTLRTSFSSHCQVLEGPSGLPAVFDAIGPKAPKARWHFLYQRAGSGC